MLTGLTNNVLETALEAGMSEHLGYDKHGATGRNGENSPPSPPSPLASEPSPRRSSTPSPATPRHPQIRPNQAHATAVTARPSAPRGIANGPKAFVSAHPAIAGSTHNAYQPASSGTTRHRLNHTASGFPTQRAQSRGSRDVSRATSPPGASHRRTCQTSRLLTDADKQRSRTPEAAPGLRRKPPLTRRFP